MTDKPSAAQIRAARAMLDWSMIDLAKTAGVSVSTVKRVQDDQTIEDRARTLIQNALEAEGVCFLPDDGRGVGVRLNRRRSGNGFMR